MGDIKADVIQYLGLGNLILEGYFKAFDNLFSVNLTRIFSAVKC